MRAMRRVTCLMSLTLMLPASAVAQAETAAAADLPDARVLRERHIEAVGGRAALERFQSSHAVGKFEIPAQGIHGALEVFAAAPNHLLVTIDVTGIGMVRTGYDGEVGWTIHPATGPMVMEGRQLDQIRQQADFYGILHPERYVASAETVEETEFAGQPAYKVKVVTHWDEEYFEFYDKETGLLTGSIRHQESPMGAIEVTTEAKAYRDFGGVRAPARVAQRMLGQEQLLTIDEVEYDQVDAALFDLPNEIRTLVSEQEASR